MAMGTCLHCGLFLHETTTGVAVHDTCFPGQGMFAGEASLGCLFHVLPEGFALCTDASLLEGTNFDIPDVPVLVGPEVSSIAYKDASVWIPFRTTGRMQLLEHRLSPILPAVELLWSWFKHLLLALEALHAMGLAHGHIEKNMIWVESTSPREMTRVNHVYLATPFLKTFSPNTLKSAQDEDVRNLALVFLKPLQTIETWQKGLYEFRELCAILAQDPQKRVQLLPRVVAAHRMACLVNAPIEKPVVDSLHWKKLLVFAGLFSISLLVAWWFAGSSSKDTPLRQPIKRKRSEPPTEAVVEIAKLRWDAHFPLHRIPFDDDVFLYLAPDQGFWKYAFDFLSFLGITLPRPPISEDDNFYSLQFESVSWKTRATRIMRKKKILSSSAPGETESVWLSLVGKGFSLKPDAISPPPVLLAEPGKLLTEVGYDPENTGRERLVLIVRPPAGQAPAGTLWSDWFGGIFPSYGVARLGQTDELRVVFSFERATDARDAAYFLENVFILAGLNTRDRIDVSDRRVRVVIPFKWLSQFSANSTHSEDVQKEDAPPPNYEDLTLPLSQPQQSLGHSDDSVPDDSPARILREFLPIPEL